MQANQTVTTGQSTSTLAITVGDAQTPVASLTVTASSSNTSLVASSGIVFGGSGANRTVTITPVSGQTGTTTITLTVTDGGGLTCDLDVRGDGEPAAEHGADHLDSGESDGDDRSTIDWSGYGDHGRRCRKRRWLR